VVMLEVAKHTWVAVAGHEPSIFGNCPKCKAKPLDFNHYCTNCKAFVSPVDCANFRELVEEATSCYCCNPGGAYRNRSHCNNCGRTRVAFDVLDSARIPGLALFCHDGCSEQLNPNRFCDTCKTIYCLGDSVRSRQCILCSGQLREGQCASSHCGARNLKWKELPYKSLQEVVRREYDAEGGTIKPKYPRSYESVVRLDLPAHPSDPSHFGHVVWQYCQFVESLDSNDS
jgi:hypothetical protein